MESMQDLELTLLKMTSSAIRFTKLYLITFQLMPADTLSDFTVWLNAMYFRRTQT